MQSIKCAEEIAYREIKHRILDGRLRPGTRLVHRALAKDLGMSPNPIVLALRMLERDGLVVNTPGLGACARQWGKTDIEDLYHIRAGQEALAAKLCAVRATSAELDAIEAAHAGFQGTIESGNEDENIQADVAIHLAIVGGAHSSDLARLVESLAIMQCSMKAFGMSLGIPRALTKDMREVHVPLIESIRRRDPEAAERCGREHVEQSLARNLAWIEELPETSVS